MSVATKFSYLKTTKNQIRTAIIDKGVSVPVGTTFRGYVAKIATIGNSVGAALDAINGEIR